eukprot:1384111-Pyramimonas_sp.AAC.1
MRLGVWRGDGTHTRCRDSNQLNCKARDGQGAAVFRARPFARVFVSGESFAYLSNTTSTGSSLQLCQSRVQPDKAMVNPCIQHALPTAHGECGRGVERVSAG